MPLILVLIFNPSPPQPPKRTWVRLSLPLPPGKEIETNGLPNSIFLMFFGFKIFLILDTREQLNKA